MNEELLNELKLAQNGDKLAEEKLIIHIRDNMMRRRIGRFLHRNRQVEDEDLIQEFLIGISMAIQKANLDIGDPIEYIVQQGVYRVRTCLRRSILKGTTQVCMDCGYETRINRVGNHYECKRCGSHNINTRELNDHDETLFETMEDTNEDIEDILFSMMMARFEETLDHNTNVYQLYVLLRDGINRDNPQVDNYIKTIAKMWGGCSTTNVMQNMRKLQAKVIKFAEENNMEIKDNKFIQIK